MDPTDTAITGGFNASEDISTQLLQRYTSSSAVQHRHLIATAAAIKTILNENSFPLTPISYFAATISAFTSENDAPSSAALATLLSIVLPLVPEGSISPDKASEGVQILVGSLEDVKINMGCTSSVRCVVKCLGVLLGFCDLDNWDSVRVSFEALLTWSHDKRPKVRKCALVYLENALKSFQSSTVTKKASKLILSLLDKLSDLRDTDEFERKRKSEAEHSDVAHVLNVVRVALPYLSHKISVKIVLKLTELLNAQFCSQASIILNVIGVFIDKVEVDVVRQVCGDITTALALYVSSENNTKEGVICATNLLKSIIDKINVGDTERWNKVLSPTFTAIAGLLTHEDDVASPASNTLKNLIYHQLPVLESESVRGVVTNDSESNPIASMCSVLFNLLDTSGGIPNEHTLAVISVLFLKLGGKSLFYMRNIILKLAEIFTQADVDHSNTCNLQKCFGCAVVGMGAENVLNIVPISFNVDNLTCSNTWLLPILNEYVYGASLRYFMEHIVPIAKSVQRAFRTVKKSVIRQGMQALARDIWGLLPAFCRHPTDISQSFHSFAKLVLIRLEKDPSMQEKLAFALQELVKQNKCLQKSDDASVESTKHSSDISLEDYLVEKRKLHDFTKKEASRNLKAIASCSDELLQALVNVFFVSPPENRLFLKKTISCLTSISDPLISKKIFISSLERCMFLKIFTVPGDCNLSDTSVNDASCDSSSITEISKWCLILDLASSVVEGADEDLVGLIFGLINFSLQAGCGTVISEAYSTLSCVLEEHPRFCSSKMEELVTLLNGLKSPEDAACLCKRLNSFHALLVHALKGDFDEENKMPFIILNEIMLTVKDSKEEVRKTAYDILIRISSSLGGPDASNPDGPYYRLISMILGYLSGPSPHITSAAISALSVLVFKEPELCLTVPDVIPSVTSLLQTKAVEVIKAVLGFIKVLVSCLESTDLQNFISVIVDGIIPWSSVSRHHFKSKVTVILEIMMRKCGVPTIKLATPERYHRFLKNVSLNRHGKNSSKEEAGSGDVNPPQISDASMNGQKKRARNDMDNDESSQGLHRMKRGRQNQGSRRPGGWQSSNDVSVNKTASRTSKDNNSGTWNEPGKFKTNKPKFDQASGKPGKGVGSYGKHRKSETMAKNNRRKS